MQELKVIGVESGALLVATDAGSEFRLPVTQSLQSQLRQAGPDQAPVVQKVSPREIQSSIRAGRTAQQVADETGADVVYVRRFEGPVLDERNFVLESARSVPVSVAGGVDALGESSRFGEVIDSRLDESSATDREWTAFKDASVGWIIRVTYTTSEVERDAAWRFEPKKQSLAPHAGDAHTLSRQDADHSSLVPRLRAVAAQAEPQTRGSVDTEAAAGSDEHTGDTGRFDSGAFEPLPDVPETVVPDPSVGSASARARDGWSAASVAAMNRAPESESSHNQTADLLEALRRRRGEREAARFDDDSPSRAAHPSTGSIRVVDLPLDEFDDGSESETSSEPVRPAVLRPKVVPDGRRVSEAPASSPAPEPRQKSIQSRGRKGRASMPSWDEIVFGARSDDDPV
ncbi:septation protein SepH [Frondihabitans sp. Leaf304]|uniref:septation protein SepH n=1 Tax=Frondihabitans sp. Leaf304 TaxID=1736329 RepID=UPI000A03CEDF|nr:septation protein SepH [Frondihabitans sp. Leaf304]